MKQLINQTFNSVELHIWQDESGEWRCRVTGPDESRTVNLGDQAALSTFIADQIDEFVAEYEQRG